AHHAARPALDLRDEIVAFFTPDECEQLIKLDDGLVVGWGLLDRGSQGTITGALDPVGYRLRT
ncbi:MAG: hypothetical protein NZM04_08035, partial [Methylacidiphilales bacterium]|nr:hypothetical protein [Candidatus Methylacidiphilales bacterium]